MGQNTAWSQCLFSSGSPLRPTDLGSQDQYTSSIAIDGSVAFMGAPRQPSATDKGTVYVATYGTSWSITQKLVAPDGAAGHQFGRSVAIEGSWAVVGAPGTEAAYVYQLTGSTWTYRQKLLPATPEPGNFFGYAVAIAGNEMAIGAYGSTTYSGRIFMFRYNGSSWVPTQVISASDGASYDFFGFSVEISNNFMVIGAYGSDGSGGTNFGSSYVYKFDGAQWTFHQKLLAPDGQSGDNFGESVAIDGLKMVVSASRDDDVGSNAGAVYVFALEGMQWGFKQKLTGSDSKPGDWFGASVAINGDLIVVGSPLWESNDGITNRGAVYPFLFDGNSWNEQTKLLAPSPFGSYDDNLGYRVALSSTNIVGGANLADWFGRDTGDAYFFGVQCSVTPSLSSIFPPDGYIDPLEDQDVTTGALLGTKDISISFSVPVTNIGGAPISLSNFERKYFRGGVEVSATTADLGVGGVAPTVILVSGVGAGPYLLRFSPRIPLGAWTQIKAINVVSSASSTPISSSGNRIIFGNLPMDITQDGKVLGDDINRWLAVNGGTFDPTPATKLLLLDQKRNGIVAGEDITRAIQLLNGTPGTTLRSWSGFNMGEKP